MSYRLLTYCMAIFISTVASCVLAQEATPRPTGNSEWYYSLGGGDPYLGYSQSDQTNIDLGVSTRWSLLNSCQFDPRASISDTFDQAQNSIYGLSNTVVNSAQGAIQSWGLSQIQNNFPGLYDFMTKGLQDAKESFNISVKNCRDYQRDLENGNNPIDGWIKAARKSRWATASASGENPTTVQDTVDTEAADNGVPWVNGEMRGGRGDDPIDVIGDTVRVGYDHVTGGGSTDETNGNVTTVGGSGVNYRPQDISTVFGSAEEAESWTTAVVGERIVRTCTNCTKIEVRVGQGLRLQHIQEKRTVIETLNNLVYGNVVPEEDSLNSLSVPGMGILITNNIIFALRDERGAERKIIINRLASEISLARLMEKALLARDLLVAGLQEPNIAANDVARSEIGDAKQRLTDEIENILFEQRVRKEVLAQTASVIGERDRVRNTASDASRAIQQKLPSRGMNSGGIPK